MKKLPQTLGLEQFLNLFGNTTISSLVTIGFALFFCYKCYKQLSKYLENKKQLAIQQYKTEQEKNEQFKKVLEEVSNYPKHREETRQIQKEFREEIDSLKHTQEILAASQQEMCASLKDMQEKQERRDRNKLRDRLLQSYRYYTNEETNPSQSWTKMESEAFWELFSDYEDAGGDGYMHTNVQPAMNLLKIIDD